MAWSCSPRSPRTASAAARELVRHERVRHTTQRPETKRTGMINETGEVVARGTGQHSTRVGSDLVLNERFGIASHQAKKSTPVRQANRTHTNTPPHGGGYSSVLRRAHRVSFRHRSRRWLVCDLPEGGYLMMALGCLPCVHWSSTVRGRPCHPSPVMHASHAMLSPPLGRFKSSTRIRNSGSEPNQYRHTGMD